MTYSLDKMKNLVYNAPMFKRLIVIASVLAVTGLTSPAVSYAQTATPVPTPTTCTTVTQYGGSVSYICGAQTPVVSTGIGDNLALFGVFALGASGILFYFSKKAGKVSFDQKP
jgi:hypothetical protein